METYRAYEVTGSRQFALTDRTVRPPAPGHVRLRVLTCGVCHSDAGTVEGRRADWTRGRLTPALTQARIPYYEDLPPSERADQS